MKVNRSSGGTLFFFYLIKIISNVEEKPGFSRLRVFFARG